MILQTFYNDLSAPEEVCAKDIAVSYLHCLVAMLRSASAVCEQIVFNNDIPLAELSFGPGWPLAVLRNDSGCSEEGLYLKTVADRAPFEKSATELGRRGLEDIDFRLRSDAHLDGRQATGLGLAHEFRGLAMSLPSHGFWNSRLIELDRHSLMSGGEIATAVIEVRNANSPEAVEHHRAGLLNDLRPYVRDGADIWTRRSALFPSLKFAPRVQEQIQRFRRGEEVLEQVRDRLFELDLAVGLWKARETPHPVYSFHVSAESATRMRLVRFDDGSGQIRSFSDHARYTPGAGRIHFILETEPYRHALIGHVGEKLQ